VILLFLILVFCRLVILEYYAAPRAADVWSTSVKATCAPPCLAGSHICCMSGMKATVHLLCATNEHQSVAASGTRTFSAGANRTMPECKSWVGKLDNLKTFLLVPDLLRHGPHALRLKAGGSGAQWTLIKPALVNPVLGLTRSKTQGTNHSEPE
jgi:hypothetical protein